MLTSINIVCIDINAPNDTTPVLDCFRDYLSRTFNFKSIYTESMQALFEQHSTAMKLFFADGCTRETMKQARLYEDLSFKIGYPIALSFGLFKDIPANEKSQLMAKLMLTNYFDFDSGAEHCANALIDTYNNQIIDNGLPLSIAIVDDCPYARDSLEMTLRTHPKISCGLFNSAEALLTDRKHLERQFNLYIVDLVMEGMSGIDLVTKIRRDNHKAVIIAVSQLQNPKVICAVINAGANEFLPKPLDMQAMARRAMAIFSTFQHNQRASLA